VKDYHRKDIKRAKGRFRKREKRGQDYKKALYNLLKTIFSISLISGMGYFTYLGCYYLSRTPYLNISHIKIEGLKKLSKDELMKMVNLGPDRNILTVNLEKIGHRLEAHPWVEKTEVRREFPSSIVISIKERKPVAIINREGLRYVDDKGVIFTRVAAGNPLDFPILTGFNSGDFKESGSSLDIALKKSLELLEIMERERIFLSSNISEINLKSDSGFTIFTSNDAFQINIGSDDFNDKLKRLKYTLAAIKREGRYNQIEYINLNYRNRVVVRLKKEDSFLSSPN
jgi:cell division protein FtsQ